MSSYQNVLNDIILKKFQTSPFTETSASIAAEKSGTSAFKIQLENIYSQPIPASAPSDLGASTPTVIDPDGTLETGTDGTYQTSTSYPYIAKYTKVKMLPISSDGRTFAYAGTSLANIVNTNVLIDAIPGNQSPDLSYKITVYENGNVTTKNYFFDTSSGYVTFFTGISSTNMRITFWRYEGNKGVNVNNIEGNLAVTLDTIENGNNLSNQKGFIVNYTGSHPLSTADYGGLADPTGFQSNCPFRIYKSDYGQYGIGLDIGHFQDTGRAYIQCQYANTGARDICLQPYAGNVGIGTTSPFQKLHVSGNIIAYSNQEGVELGEHEIKMTNTGAAHYSIFNDGSFKVNNTSSINHTGTIGTNLFTIKGDGNVGIGTESPNVPLEITASINKYVSAPGSSSSNFSPYFLYSFEGAKKMSSQVDVGITKLSAISLGTEFAAYWTRDVSMYLPNGHVVGTGFVAAENITISSDERIKTNIKEINDDEALKKLRLLKPCKYNYIDYIKRGITPVYGFIAQEVREVLPYAVSDGMTLNNLIPNIYKFCHVTNGTILSFIDFDISNNITIDGVEYDIPNVDCTTSKFQRDASNNISITLKKKDNKEITRNIINIIDEKTFEIDVKIENNETSDDGIIFVYGQVVNDFCTLNKSAIWTVATAALQEVDRQLQTEKAKTASLETQVANLHSQFNDLLNKFNTLETTIQN